MIWTVLYGIHPGRSFLPGIYLYVMSNCQEGYLNAFLDHHQMHAFFDDYETAGRTGKSMGENIRMVIERNSIDQAVYVGDTTGDQMAADEQAYHLYMQVMDSG